MMAMWGRHSTRRGITSVVRRAAQHLDVKNRVIGFTEAARGGIDSCPVDLRSVFRAAIAVGATAIVVAHNHPSGDPTPSPEDVTVTQKIVQGGLLLDIEVLDHLIVGQGRFVSLKERGLGFKG